MNYEQHGLAFLKELGEAAPPTLPELLDRHFTRLLLGDFDLRVPNSMLAKVQDPARVAGIATALLDLQARLDELTTSDPGTQKSRSADIATLRKYLASWRTKPAAADASSLPQRANPCLLVIAPDRKTFVGLAGWLGLWKQMYRDIWWNDGTATCSDMRLQDEGNAQVIAIEYAAPDQNGDVTLGYDMNTREKTGLLQHVVQRAAMSWCWRELGDKTDLTFVLGFATDLVVDVLGQNNARSGGSGKATSTVGVGGFIPGAPGRGGGMLMVNADSSWRLSQGQDYFVRPLRQAQKAGEHAAADSKDKLGHFLLRIQKSEKTHRVETPFLGSVAYDRSAIPDEFLDDYMEFHRAYRAGFVHWLQIKGMKGKSAEQFTALLLRLMQQKAGDSLDGLCQELYGIPLASKSPQVDTLERRFLAWIADSSR